MKRCRGSVVAVRVCQGACRPLTDATLWRAGALQIFCEDFGAGLRWLQKIGTLCFTKWRLLWKQGQQRAEFVCRQERNGRMPIRKRYMRAEIM